MLLKYFNQTEHHLKSLFYIFFISSFFALFFGINQVKAAQECSWWYISPGLFQQNNCNSLQGTTLTPGGCTNITRPPGGTAADYICCCKPETTNKPAPKTDLPTLKMPELQISIPNLVLSKIAAIKCEKDAKGNNTSCAFPWIGEYIAGIYKYAIGVVGILAAVVLMIGGVLWIIAGGNATMIGEAKAWIGASITGLVIALSSYLILYQVNPNLVIFGPLNLKMVQKIELPPNLIAENNLRSGQQANDYKNKDCSQLNVGDTADFFITSYCKPLKNEYTTLDSFLCAVALNCSCPNGNRRDTSKQCTGSIAPWNPCYPINDDNYCNRNAAGSTPATGTVAADASCFNFGSTLTINGKNYTVQDRGGAIKGKRLDVWSEGCKNLTMNGTMNVTVKSK